MSDLVWFSLDPPRPLPPATNHCFLMKIGGETKMVTLTILKKEDLLGHGLL